MQAIGVPHPISPRQWIIEGGDLFQGVREDFSKDMMFKLRTNSLIVID